MLNKIAVLTIVSILTLSWTCPKKVGGVYRYQCGITDSYKVWIIDGNTVRQKIHREFLYGGNELRYVFNPEGEIWIENAISCEETGYSIALELKERQLMSEGKSYSEAYEEAVGMVQKQRESMMRLAKSHFKITIPDSLERDSGIIDRDEKDFSWQLK